MKNIISFFYNIKILNLKKKSNNFFFQINQDEYIFQECEIDYNQFNNIYRVIMRFNKPCHQPVLNKDGSILTFYKGKTYMLLKKFKTVDYKLTFEDIINYDNVFIGKINLEWKELWEKKIDYYEYQMRHFGLKFPKLKESFSYYLGLSENAISLLNYINVSKINGNIAHKRIKKDESVDEFLNCLDIIIDNKARDIAEYFKINFINNKIDKEAILESLDKVFLETEEVILLLARMMYPSYYYDVYDQIIQGNIEEDQINIILKNNEIYESLLKTIYGYYKSKYDILNIEWLEIN